MSNKKASLLKTNFFQRSQQKINGLRQKLLELSSRQKELDENEKINVKKGRKEAPEVKVVISTKSVVKATVAIFLLIGLVSILGIIKTPITIFMAALFLSATFGPGVETLHRFGIPRALGIILIYILIIGLFVVIFSSLIPIIAKQLGQIALSIRDMVQNLIAGKNSDSWILQQIQPYLNQLWENVDQAQVISSLSDALKTIASNLTNLAGNAVGAVISIFNGIFNLILVLMFTFFMILHKQSMRDFFHSLFPKNYSPYISHKTKQISIRLVEWIRGQLLLAMAMGLLTFFIFSIIGLDYSVTLAFVSAIGEFMPYIGPLVTFVSAALIAFNQDPVLILWLIPAYMVIQFFESYIFVPLIVGRSVGLNPVVVIFSLLMGASLGYSLGGGVGLGIVGMIVAIPTANIISLFVEDYTQRNK